MTKGEKCMPINEQEPSVRQSKPLSTRETIVLTTKVLGGTGVVFMALWLLDRWAQ